MLTDGSRTFEWNGEDRLKRITHSDNSTSSFAYDGLGRRARITEKNAAGVTTSDRTYVWDGYSISEEREASTNAVLKRYFPQGVSIFNTQSSTFQSFFYTRDHLGSVREVIDATGSVRARYDYSPWGERTKLSGDIDADVGFTGHFTHGASGLVLAPYREYAPELGRWLSRDPIGEVGGINLYGYCLNDPVNFLDPLGLDASTKLLPFGFSFSYHVPFTDYLPGEAEHEKQHRSDHKNFPGMLSGAAMEQRAFAAQLNAMKNRKSGPSSRKCLSENEKKELSNIDDHWNLVESFAKSVANSKTYYNITRTWYQKKE